MEESDMLKGKRVLIVDDEPDILGLLVELLDMCVIDQAGNYEDAKQLIRENSYDAAVLDIMGVQGYDLLTETDRKKIPTLMLTANALDAENFVRTIHCGAHAYVPKDRIIDITLFLKDILVAKDDETQKSRWFKRLESYFEKRFGKEWQKKEDKKFWEKYFYL